jgi:hypothetical protein
MKNITFTISGVMQPGFPLPVLLASEMETMTDEVVPGYRDRIARGEVINNACNYQKISVGGTGGGTRVATHKTTGAVHNVGGGGSLTQYYRTALSAGLRPTPVATSCKTANVLINQAAAAALAQVDSSPYSFAEDIATWKQTAGFLKNPLASLGKLSKAFSTDVAKLQERRKALQRAQAIADVWLSYRFAFSPLIKSINTAIDAYAAPVERPARRTARGSATDMGQNLGNNQVKGSPPNQYWWDVGSTLTRQASAVILYEVSNPVTDWRFKYGLRTKDLPELIWDLVPYSFMVDRISDVGQTIRGLTNLADPAVKILAGSTTIREESSNTYRLTKNVGNSNYNISISPDDVTEKTFTYTRVVWIPTWTDTVSRPDLAGLVSSTTKVADLLALVTKQLR